MSQHTNMSDPFSGSQGSLASPYKRKYEPPVKKAQLWAPSYIRMCALSFAIPLQKLPIRFVNPEDEDSISRGVHMIMAKLKEKAAQKHSMQCRKNNNFGLSGGMRTYVSAVAYAPLLGLVAIANIPVFRRPHGERTKNIHA